MISSSRKAEGLVQPLIQGVGQQARGQVISGVPVHSLRLDGASAKQEILLTGPSEILNISHEVSSVQAYALGILHSIRFASSNPGLTIGLDRVLGI